MQGLLRLCYIRVYSRTVAALTVVSLSISALWTGLNDSVFTIVQKEPSIEILNMYLVGVGMWFCIFACDLLSYGQKYHTYGYIAYLQYTVIYVYL